MIRARKLEKKIMWQNIWKQKQGKTAHKITDSLNKFVANNEGHR